MKEQFIHTLTNSFMLWFDNFLLKKGEAFSNQTGAFYHTPDNFLDDSYVPFSSPYKQFVTDSSIVGATLPTGIAGNSHYIDYDNGRIVETGSNYTSSSTITGTFAVKDFNIYFTNETEEDLVIIMEMCRGGELFNYIVKRKVLSLIGRGGGKPEKMNGES